MSGFTVGVIYEQVECRVQCRVESRVECRVECRAYFTVVTVIALRSPYWREAFSTNLSMLRGRLLEKNLVC